MDASKEGRYWMKFFLEAGIPSNIGADYTVKFIDHRIQKSILEDLSRDVLLEMGIKAMGDVIAILKHAKRVSLEVDRQSLRKSKRHDEDDDDDVIMEEYSEPVAVVAAPRRTKSAIKEKPKKKVITVKPTTTTTTKTKTIKKQTAKPKQIHDDDDDDDVTMLKRISAIRQETMTSPSQKSVFTRLGSDVTTDTEQLNTSSDVFRRLGDLQPSVTSTTCDDVTMMDVDDDVTSTVQPTQQQQRKKATVVKRKNFAPSSGILSRLGDAKIEVSVGKNSNEKRVISSSSREPMVIRLPLVSSRDHPVVSSTSDSPPKRYTSMHSDHLDDNQHRPVVAKKRSIGGGSASSGVLRLKKKRTSAPSSLGMATVKSSAGSTVFNRLGTHKSPSSKMPTTTKPVVKTTKMAAGKRVSMATMDQIVTSSSVRSRLGASPKIVKKSSSMTNLGGGASDKSRISKLLQSSGGRVRIKKSSMTKSSSLSAGVLKRGGGGTSSSGNSVFDRLGGR